MKSCLLLLVLAVLNLTFAAQAQDVDGWRTVLATEQELKDFPAGQVSLEEGLLRVRAGNGILLPQPGADGAIRARFHFRERTGFPQLRIRRNGNAEAKNTDYYEVILFIKPGQTSVKEGYVNVTTRGKGRRLGVVPLGEPLVVGGSVDLELSAVGARLQILVNGKVAFEINDSTLATGAYWGLAALDGWYSHVQVRSILPKSTDPRIQPLEAAYAAALEREVTAVHLEAVKSLDAKYAAALDRALEATTQAGNLDAAVALRAEKKRLEDRAPLPADDSTAGESLKPLRTTYRSSLSQLAAQRDQRVPPLREKLIQAFAAYEDELTRAGKLDAALAVRKRRELVAGGATVIP
ncbi:MAG: hypothetical protein B7Z47_03945 [Chthoniobacter sp. 12-60-6]|nr:MAG: hypothetical protein B7Z47_03945 [Chthoniobacter sp. 12-60-6]